MTSRPSSQPTLIWQALLDAWGRRTEPLAILPLRTHAIALALGVALTALLLVFFPRGVVLAADQNIQVAAATALHGEGRLLGPPHWTRMRGETVRLPSDRRQISSWYPPGYSVLLACGLQMGFSASQSALGLFVINRVLSIYLSVLFGLSVGSSIGFVAPIVAAAFFLDSPSTTTDQLLVPFAMGLLLLSRRDLRNWTVHFIAAGLICAAILLRYQAVVLAPVWVAWCFLLDRNWRSLGGAAAGLVIAALGYLMLTHQMAGGGNLYAVGTSSVPLHLIQVPRGIWFALTGGWTPVSGLLRCLVAAAVLLAVAEMVRRSRYLQAWEIQVLTFQALMFAFLLVTQARYGNVYSDRDPAFAVARYYGSIRPALLLMICASAAAAIPAWQRSLRVAVVVLIVVAAGQWTLENRASSAGREKSEDGFLREIPIIALGKHLKDRSPDAIVSDSVYLPTLVDVHTLFPTTLARLTGKPGLTAVAVIESADEPATPECLRDWRPVEKSKFGDFHVLEFVRTEGNEN